MIIQRQTIIGAMSHDMNISDAIVITLFGLYAIYTEATYLELADEVAYGTSLVIGALTLLCLPLTIYRMSNLTFKVR